MSSLTYKDFVYECNPKFIYFNSSMFVIVLILSVMITIKHRNMMKISNYLIIYANLAILACRATFYIIYYNKTIPDGSEYCQTPVVFTDDPEKTNENMSIIVNMLFLYRTSFFFDNILYVFSYIFILKTDLFWDIIICEKMKTLYEVRDQLEEEDKIQVEESYLNSLKNLKKKQGLYRFFIYGFILIMIFLFAVLISFEITRLQK